MNNLVDVFYAVFPSQKKLYACHVHEVTFVASIKRLNMPNKTVTNGRIERPLIHYY